jgi:hypothetical protein
MACANDNPRILFLDIETKLVELYSFGIRDQYITHKQIKDLDASARSIHCVGLKWAGERKVRVLSEWGDSYRGMIEGVHAALCEADAVATYNGANFDLPKLEGQFLLLGLEPPPPPTQIDIFKTTRKMGFVSSKLDYIAPILGLGSKVKHPGLEMWIDCHNGCEKAQAKMTRYCAGDVRLTEDVFNRVKPFMRNFPRLRSGGECSACGSDNVQRRGYNYSKKFKTERIMCLESGCRAWTTGRRTAA